MKVVNLRREKYTVYIGRGGIFGNPFVIGKDGTREEVIRKYKEFVKRSPSLMEVIGRLSENAVLGCYCKPLACHGDAIVEIWNENKGRKGDG